MAWRRAGLNTVRVSCHICCSTSTREAEAIHQSSPWSKRRGTTVAHRVQIKAAVYGLKAEQWFIGRQSRTRRIIVPVFPDAAHFGTQNESVLCFDVRVAAPRRRCPTYTARLKTDPHLRLTGFRLTRRFGFAQATGSLTIGGVDDIKTTVVEVHNIARRKLGPSHLSSGCDLCACVAERSSAWQ